LAPADVDIFLAVQSAPHGQDVELGRLVLEQGRVRRADTQQRFNGLPAKEDAAANGKREKAHKAKYGPNAVAETGVRCLPAVFPPSFFFPVSTFFVAPRPVRMSLQGTGSGLL